MQKIDNSLLKQFTAYTGLNKPVFEPSNIWLELTRNCNLSCIICREIDTREKITMDVSLFKRIIDETRDKANCYFLFGRGESLILHDFLERFDYVISVKKDNTKMWLYTNGMFLYGDISRKLLKHNTIVSVSFDGASANTFEKIRRGSDFEIICSNLKACTEHDKLNNPPLAGIHVSIQRDNWRELNDIINLVNTIGVRRVSFGILDHPNELRPPLDEKLASSIKRALINAKKKGIFIIAFPISFGDYVWWHEDYRKRSKFMVNTNCDTPNYCIAISANGDVAPCCRWPIIIDNIRDKTLEHIWLGSDLELFRRNVNKTEYNNRNCRNCSLVNRL